MPQILIIDDSRLAAMVVQRHLQPKGIECVHVASVNKLFGLKGESPIIQNYQPDVILLDILMPEMDGIGVLRKLKSRADTKSVPVIMLSASASERNIRLAHQDGAVGFLAKPIKPEALYEGLLKAAQSTHSPQLEQELARHIAPNRVIKEEKAEFKVGPADLNYMLEILDGDQGLMKELVEVFLEDMPKQVADMRSALENASGHDLYHAAHRFKGSVGNFGCPAISDAAFALEKMGRANTLDEAQSTFDTLSKDVESLHSALGLWLKSQS